MLAERRGRGRGARGVANMLAETALAMKAWPIEWRRGQHAGGESAGREGVAGLLGGVATMLAERLRWRGVSRGRGQRASRESRPCGRGHLSGAAASRPALGAWLRPTRGVANTPRSVRGRLGVAKGEGRGQALSGSRVLAGARAVAAARSVRVRVRAEAPAPKLQPWTTSVSEPSALGGA